MPVRRPRRSLVFVLLLVATCAGGATAQTNERIYEELDFRFVTPGARAVGMGKAFIGLSDDATASASNPAGLSNLLQQEFSVEFTATRIRHHRLVPGEGAQERAFGDLVLTPSFFSFVLPARRATFSFFRHAVQHYREEFELAGRFVPAVNDFEDGAFGSIAIEAENYGFSAAYVLSSFLSVGGTLNLTTVEVASESRSGEPLSPRNGTNTIDDARRVTGVLGVLVKPSGRLAVGATYNGGATFDMSTTLFGTFLVTLPAGRTNVVRSGARFPIEYVIPDRYAIGTSWRPLDNLTLLFDVTRIRYSQLVGDGFLIVDFQDPDAGLTRGARADRLQLEERLDQLQCGDPCNFFIDDAYELHGGVEYRRYGQAMTTAFRAGVFTDPDHSLRFGRGGNNPRHPADALLDYRFNTIPSRTDVGVTAGAGLALRNRFQVDVAASFSRDATDVVVSTVVRIGN